MADYDNIPAIAVGIEENITQLDVVNKEIQKLVAESIKDLIAEMDATYGHTKEAEK